MPFDFSLPMDNYKAFVENAAKTAQSGTGDKQVFFNSGPNHAAIVISSIFKHSTKEILIFCGGLDAVVSNDEDFLRNLDDFLRRNGTVKIFMQRNSTDDPKAKIFKVLKKYPNNYELYQIAVKITNGNSDTPIHFMVGDDIFLRVETGTSDYTAEVRFGDKEETQIYKDVFAKLSGYNPTKLVA